MGGKSKRISAVIPSGRRRLASGPGETLVSTNGLLGALLVLLALLPVLPVPVGGVAPIDDAPHTWLGNVGISFLGEGDNEESGRGEAFLGDVNGDGRDDFAITSNFADEPGNGDVGKIYLFFGRVQPWGANLSLANSDASYYGEDPDDRAGRRVTGPGDLDGDGFDDFVVAGPEVDSNGSNSGACYLFYGRSQGWILNGHLNAADARIIGQPGHRFCNDVAGPGDVNADGYPDLLVGTDSTDRAYLFYGGPQRLSGTVTTASAAATFVASNGDRLGWDVSWVGDVNGDQIDDLLMGAPYAADGGNWDAGKAYLYFGRPEGWKASTGAGEADVTFLGPSATSQAGYTVAGPGDVNGDGLDDVLVGAPKDSPLALESGSVYLYLGRPTAEWQPTLPAALADTSFIGTAEDHELGEAIPIGSDVNGDGLSDMLLCGAPNDTLDQHAGEAYLILGSLVGWTSNQPPLPVAAASYIGEASYDRACDEAGGGGDLDGDGLDDFLIGAPQNDQAGNGMGKAYGLTPAHNDRPNGVLGVTVYGDVAREQPIATAAVGQRVFVQVDGLDASPLSIDRCQVEIRSDSHLRHIRIDLTETALNSGAYAGEVLVTNRTHERFGWIAADLGDTLTLSSVEAPAKSIDLPIRGIDLPANLTDLVVLEDATLDLPLVAVNGTATGWDVRSDGGWVTFDPLTIRLQGTPTHADVGSYWLQVETGDAYGNVAERNLSLQVLNRPPQVLIAPPSSVDQDATYAADLDSDDDPYSAIVWALSPPGAWLSIDNDSGALLGTPRAPDVGLNHFNVSMVDDLGGVGWFNLTILVGDLPDAPSVTTMQLPPAWEDSFYEVTLNGSDPDIGSLAPTWRLLDAPAWLSLDGTLGLLLGTPENADVGIRTITIEVSDAEDHRTNTSFPLEVRNTNDPPLVVSQPPTAAAVGSPFLYQVEAVDDDIGEVLHYELDTWPSGMSIGSTTGLLEWVPAEGQRGMQHVIIAIGDGNATVVQDFSIVVNSPPRFESLPPPMAKVGVDYVYQPLVTDPDGIAGLRYTLIQAPDGMAVATTTGRLVWTPQGRDVGLHTVSLQVVDAFTSAEQRFGIEVLSSSASDAPSVELLDPVDGVAVYTTLVQLRWHATDPDGDPISASVFLSNDSLAVALREPSTLIGNVTGQVSQLRVPTPLVPGQHYSWAVSVSDGLWQVHGTQTFDFLVSPRATVNEPPLAVGPANWEFVVETSATFSLLASDVEGDTLTFSLLEGPEGATVSRSGAVSWTPAKSMVGQHLLQWVVDDGSSRAVGVVHLTVQASGIDGGKDDHRAGPGVLSVFTSPLGLAALGVLGAVVLLALVVARRRKDHSPTPAPPPVDEAAPPSSDLGPRLGTEPGPTPALAKGARAAVDPFHVVSVLLIHADGRLITHRQAAGTPEGEEEEDELPADLVSGMLVAIQTFVQESFKSEAGLQTFAFDRFKVVLHGQGEVLAAVLVSGTPPPQMAEELERVAVAVNGNYGAMLDHWDGDLEGLPGIEGHLEPIFALERSLVQRKVVRRVRVRSGLEFFQGYLRLKVAVVNDTTVPISGCELLLDFDHAYLRLDHIEPALGRSGEAVLVGTVPGREKRTVAYLLDPVICQTSTLGCTLSYGDVGGTRRTLVMKPKPLDVVCPIFYTPKTVNLAILRRLLSHASVRDHRSFRPPSSMTLDALYQHIRDIVAGYDVRMVRELAAEDAPVLASDQPMGKVAWFYGKVPQGGEEIVITVAVNESGGTVELGVACRNVASLTGLLADIAHQVVKSKPTVRSTHQPNSEDVVAQTMHLLEGIDEDPTAPQGPIGPAD